MIPFLIICSILVIAIIILAVYCIIQNRYKDFVLQNSVCLKQLNELNSRYNFYPYVSFDQSHTYDNKNFYNTISCEDYLIYQLQFIRKKIFDQIDKVNSNKRMYSSYKNEVKNINQFGKFDVSTGKLKLDKLVGIEKKFIEKQTIQAPVTQFSLTVTLYCSTINGKIRGRKRENFSVDDVLTIIKRLANRRGAFYCDREIWDAICRVERGKVSNKMRFSIYARDGHRCCNCGIPDRYAQLEIDHIIPIAKGGKTTYNNLQTLCHRCNVKKGDSLY